MRSSSHVSSRDCVYHNVYYNPPFSTSAVTLARLTLERRIGVKGTEVNAGKRNQSYSMVNAIGDNVLRALRRPNKGRKYNSNTPKDRNNRTKGLALLSRCPSR